MSQKRLGDIVVYALLTLLAVVFLFPLYYMVTRSLMTPGDIFSRPPKFVPTVATWSNFAVAWHRAPFLKFTLNSVKVVVLQVVGVTFSAALCGYGFARFKFPGRELIFAFVLSTLMLPGVVTLIPLYVIFRDLHWLNTLWPLTIPGFFGGGAFNIFLFRQFYRALPKDMDEAAEIDGANIWQTFAHIIMPLSLPVFTVVATLTFLSGWTDLLSPLVYLNTPDQFTLALGVNNVFQGQYGPAQQNYVAAISLMLVLPPLLLYAFVQRYLVEGIVTTGIKG